MKISFLEYQKKKDLELTFIIKSFRVWPIKVYFDVENSLSYEKFELY